jgi:hypothetical protein
MEREKNGQKGKNVTPTQTQNPEPRTPSTVSTLSNPSTRNISTLKPYFPTLNQDETHVTSPGQQRSERQWSLIFVTAIATASVMFETLKEMAMENTPPTMIKVRKRASPA